MHHLTQEQVRALLQAIPDDRDRTALLVAYLHGLRITETIRLRVCDVASGYIIVPRLKGSNRTVHTLYAPSDLASAWMDEKSALEDLVTKYQLGPEDRFFSHPRGYYNRLMITYGVGPPLNIPRVFCHPHALKHSIAKHLRKKHIGLEELRTYLGHKSLASTGMYLQVDDAEASQAAHVALEEK